MPEPEVAEGCPWLRVCTRVYKQTPPPSTDFVDRLNGVLSSRGARLCQERNPHCVLLNTEKVKRYQEYKVKRNNPRINGR